MESFDSFRKRSLEDGADEVVERRWGAGQIVETHTHPFEARALVAEVPCVAAPLLNGHIPDLGALRGQVARLRVALDPGSRALRRRRKK